MKVVNKTNIIKSHKHTLFQSFYFKNVVSLWNFLAISEWKGNPTPFFFSVCWNAVDSAWLVLNPK